MGGAQWEDVCDVTLLRSLSKVFYGKEVVLRQVLVRVFGKLGLIAPDALVVF